MKKLAIVLKTGSITLVLVSAFTAAHSQSINPTGGLTMLQILPFITFVLALVTGMLNLYIMNKLGKTKDDILNIVRSEFKNELHDLESRTASKDLVNGMKNELMLMLKNIELQIGYSIKISEK